MDVFFEVFGAFAAFKIVTDLVDVILGTWMVFGALKWKKGLITYTSILWGLALGLAVGVWAGEMFESEEAIFIAFLVTAFLVPVLTYRVPAMNRFIVGYIVVMKLCFMLTTVLFKSGDIELSNMFIVPLVVGVLSGIGFALWSEIAVFPFVLACAFVGASIVAPTLSEYTNMLITGITRDLSGIVDPIDLIFGIFKIELTDGWTLFYMAILMGFGIPAQIRSIEQQGFSLDTPVIVYETEDRSKHGKIERR